MFDGNEYLVRILMKKDGNLTWWEVEIYEEYGAYNLPRKLLFVHKCFPPYQEIDYIWAVRQAFQAYHDTIIEQQTRKQKAQLFFDMGEIDSSDWRMGS